MTLGVGSSSNSGESCVVAEGSRLGGGNENGWVGGVNTPASVVSGRLRTGVGETSEDIGKVIILAYPQLTPRSRSHRSPSHVTIPEAVLPLVSSSHSRLSTRSCCFTNCHPSRSHSPCSQSRNIRSPRHPRSHDNRRSPTLSCHFWYFTSSI